MKFDITWHPVDGHWLEGTFVAALAGKQVGAETFALASRWSRRRLIKSISDCYKRAAQVVLRDEPEFDLELYIWGRPYFILMPEAEAASDALVELETLRDAESIMLFFYRQMARKGLHHKRDAIEALARSQWSDEPQDGAAAEALTEFRSLVHRAEAACVAAEGKGKVRTHSSAEVRRTKTAPLLPNYEPPSLEGLSSRGHSAAQLIEASEVLSYSAVAWMRKVGPCWQQNGLEHTLSRLCAAYPQLEPLTGPPSELFDALRGRFPHVYAAMAQQLDNNYSAGRTVPPNKMAGFIAWWRAHQDELTSEPLADSPHLYNKVLEAALYSRVKNWTLVEASDVLMSPFTEQLP